jgi:hypothetical protein
MVAAILPPQNTWSKSEPQALGGRLERAIRLDVGAVGYNGRALLGRCEALES